MTSLNSRERGRPLAISAWHFRVWRNAFRVSPERPGKGNGPGDDLSRLGPYKSRSLVTQITTELMTMSVREGENYW
jgi:hypothetical protein